MNDAIGEMIINYNLFGEQEAVVEINYEKLGASLINLLGKISLTELVALITNEYQETIEYAGLCAGKDKCRRTTLLFNPHRLDVNVEGKKDSVLSAMRNPKITKGLARTAKMYAKNGMPSSDFLFQSIQLGFNGVQYVNDFPASVARDLLKKYNIGPNDRVLDPCAGWGGRMLGTSVVCKNYVCFEPSTKTVEGLKKLTKFIRRFNPDFNPVINKLPYEDAQIFKGAFDFALTSPPYYNTEIYSDEPTNSLNRYENFNEWCLGFYYPMISNTMLQLKPGRPFILNIGDRKHPLSERLLKRFGDKYKIEREEDKLATGGGMRAGEDLGEKFYVITSR